MRSCYQDYLFKCYMFSMDKLLVLQANRFPMQNSIRISIQHYSFVGELKWNISESWPLWLVIEFFSISYKTRDKLLPSLRLGDSIWSPFLRRLGLWTIWWKTNPMTTAPSQLQLQAPSQIEATSQLTRLQPPSRLQLLSRLKTVSIFHASSTFPTPSTIPAPSILAPSLDIQQARQCKSIDSLQTIFWKLLIEDGVMDIPLCRMVSMQIVRPALQIDIANMRKEFYVGYCLGSQVFYVSLEDIHGLSVAPFP